MAPGILRRLNFAAAAVKYLRLISQAVTKSLPLVIARRVDEAIGRGRGGWRSYQLFRTEYRKAFGQVVMGLTSAFSTKNL